MDEQQKNNIRVIFTAKANSALDGIVKNFNLEETTEEFLKKTEAGKFSNEVIIDHLAKDFSIGKISEKDLINSLQKETGVPQQTAEKISKEIITNIIPFLEKVPEEKLQDPNFVEQLEEKILGQKKGNLWEEKDTDIFPKIKPTASVVKPIEKITPPAKKSERFKKPIVSEKTEKPAPQIKQSKGPDSYRESIE